MLELLSSSQARHQNYNRLGELTTVSLVNWYHSCFSLYGG